MTPTRFFRTHLQVPKAGNTPAECEDALRVSPDVPYHDYFEDAVIAAMCDGASESMLVEHWAGLLAETALQHASTASFFDAAESFSDFATDAIVKWRNWLAEYLATRSQQGRPLKWYEEAKIPQGAFSTLLVMRVDPTSDDHAASWKAAALGDTCLFHVRDEQVIESFPIQNINEFGNTPMLFGSLNRDVALISERTQFRHGICEAGDELFIMTDALAAWFFSCNDKARSEEALHQLRKYSLHENLEDFTQWISELRATGEIHNDDVSVIHVEVQG
ncbi:protein phosphatase 2C domain-containing protein [Actinopolymorpha singaporensis]|uniref:protein phosphatase 2C domain-containing protein n=1 Tax=Actinopolymorpha singaporensis TaxID=117157 RepID=UPI0024112DDB|nr:protein phosphatase 2C domain-containing protein [Actinopolymorpha singaporensis]